MPRRLLAVVLAGGSYAALAILGWGGSAPFLSHPPLLGLLVVLFALSVIAFFAGGSLSPGVREDKGNRWVLPVFTLIGFANAYVPAYCDRRELLTFDGDTVRWLGVALFGMGGALRLWPVFALGYRFSGFVAIQAGHTLVTDGPYSVIRHPSYLGLLVSSLGWALAFRSGIGVLLTVLLLPPLVARIQAEERMLSSEFGEEYNVYRNHTSRLIPGVY